MKKRLLGSRLLSGLLVLLTAVGTGIMLTNRAEGILTVYGLRNLKFFTVESNLLVGVVHLIMLAASGTRRTGIPLWLERLNYLATVAVSLTFAVVMLFFGPSLGYGEMVKGANLLFHLVNPLLAILSLCLFHRRRTPLWETAAALIPTVLYGLYYTGMLLRFGVHFPETDWYGFAGGGVVGSVITAAVILLLTWLLALLLRLASGGAGGRS